MAAQLTFETIAWLAAFLIFVGVITGFLSGLFGVGGGAILVPALFELFEVLQVPDEVQMPLCVGTSLAIIIPTSIRSYLSHRARGAVDGKVLRAWAIPAVCGDVAGSLIARHAPGELFKLVFIMVAGITAFRLLFGRDSWRLADDFPRGVLFKVFGFGIGLLSTLMGIGGGQLSNLLFTFYGRPIHQAIATSAGLGVLISIPGAIGYIYAGWPVAAAYPGVEVLQFPLALGYVSLIAALIVFPTTVATASLGVRAAHALPKRPLEILFGLFLVTVCARFVLSVL
jgi:uncharacterized membrane protein YfcA